MEDSLKRKHEQLIQEGSAWKETSQAVLDASMLSKEKKQIARTTKLAGDMNDVELLWASPEIQVEHMNRCKKESKFNTVYFCLEQDLNGIRDVEEKIAAVDQLLQSCLAKLADGSSSTG